MKYLSSERGVEMIFSLCIVAVIVAALVMLIITSSVAIGVILSIVVLTAVVASIAIVMDDYRLYKEEEAQS